MTPKEIKQYRAAVNWALRHKKATKSVPLTDGQIASILAHQPRKSRKNEKFSILRTKNSLF